MYNFFADKESLRGDRFFITGPDYNHIKNVLRMRAGEEFLVSCGGVSSLCRLEGFEDGAAVALVIEENTKSTELPVKIHLFQGLPKSDKMELIIQKTVELGVCSVTPVEMKRSVVKLDDKKKKSHRARWQSIAESAAKQSKRNIIPEIGEVLSFKEALKKASSLDLILVPYENESGISSTKEALSAIKSGMSVGIFIGPEGGFDEGEITAVTEIGGRTVSLGKRILRTETAAITSVGMCMLYTEMNIGEDD